MDHPSIMKLLEDDEDESMHSGADVEALSAALNRDIGGDSSTFSQPSDSESVGVLPQAGSSASQQLLDQWQASSQDENIFQDIQPKEEKLHSQSDQPSSQVESAQQVSSAKEQCQQNGAQPKHDHSLQKLLHLEQSQELQSEKKAPQSVRNDEVKSSDQISFQSSKLGSSSQHSETQQQNTCQQLDQVKTPDQPSFQHPKAESSSQHSETQQQNMHQQLNAEQQTTAANEADTAAKRMRGSPSIPFQLLIPIIRPHLDKDRNMQLQSVFTKLRTNEVSKEDFLRVIRNIVGDQMLRQAVNKVHMQIQTQAAKNQETSPNQFPLQNQASQQKPLPSGAHQYADPRAFSSISTMSSSHNQKSLRSSPSQPVRASTGQMKMDAGFPPVENSGQSSRELENSLSERGMHASQMPSTGKNIVNAEREVLMNPLQGINKQQQHSQRPQPSFPMYGESSNNFHPHPFARPPITAPTNSFRPQPPDSNIRPSAHAQGLVSPQAGLAQSGNVIDVPKYELQSIGNDAKRLHGGSLTSHSTSQQLPASWHTMSNREQRGSLPPMPYVKQEVVDQGIEPQNKSQLAPLDGSSFGSGHVSQGNPALETVNKEGIEKQSSRIGFLTSLNSMGSQAISADSTLQMSSPLVAGTITKTPSKKPSVGQKKPLEAAANSSAGASKKQKTSGTFHDQSIEHLNDVTAVSGVNLREEEEQLLAAPKEDNRASEATRRVVQAEEERLILQKGPLQKKLADIMCKSGLKRIGSDVERCLSMCVEERLRGVISSLIRLSKQRVDIEKTTHRFVITSDVHRHILEVNRKAKEEWDKKQAEEAEKLRKVNDGEGNTGSDVDKDKDDGRAKINKANKEEDDKMRTTAANVAARAAVGGDDVLSKWQLMAEQARQKREGVDVPSSSHPGKAANSRPSHGIKRNSREQQEAHKKGSSFPSISGGSRKFGRNPTSISQHKVACSISRKDVIAVLEREPQMSKSTLIYRLYEKPSGDSVV